MVHKLTKRAVLLLPLALLSFAFGCAVAPLPQRELPPAELSAAEELEISKQAYRQIVQQHGGIYPDQELNLYLAGVGHKLADQSQAQYNYRFQLLNESRPLVFSLPDGSVAITRGLLVKLQSEAQLAAVLGSEIGHIIAGHHLQGLDADALRGNPVALLDELSAESEYATLVSRMSRIGADLVSKRFTPAQETEADRIAVDLMAAAGYTPRAAVEVQQLYLDLLETWTGNQDLGSLFYSHPFAEERLVKTGTYVASLPESSSAEDGAVDFLLRVEPLRLLAEGYALYDQGRLLEKQQRIDDALEAYHQALLEAPDEPLIMTGLGLAYLRNEDQVPARRYLIKAVSLQGDYAQSRLGLGYVYLQKWQYAQAIGQLEKSLQLLPTVEAAFLLAEAQQQVGQKSSARDLYLIVASVDREGKLGRLAAERLQSLPGD